MGSVPARMSALRNVRVRAARLGVNVATALSARLGVVIKESANRRTIALLHLHAVHRRIGQLAVYAIIRGNAQLIGVTDIAAISDSFIAEVSNNSPVASEGGDRAIHSWTVR